MPEHHDESNTARFEQQMAINRDEQGRIVQMTEHVPSRWQLMNYRNDTQAAMQELLMAQDAFEAWAEHSDADVDFPIPRLLSAKTEGNLVDGCDGPAG